MREENLTPEPPVKKQNLTVPNAENAEPVKVQEQAQTNQEVSSVDSETEHEFPSQSASASDQEGCCSPYECSE
jgi:hypothetical protein